MIAYEATIEDPKVFTRPWKISMPLYRRQEKNAQILEFKCVEFVEELMYGTLAQDTAEPVIGRRQRFAATANRMHGDGMAAGRC